MNEDPGGFVLFVFWLAAVLIAVSGWQGGFEIERLSDDDEE